MDGARVSAPGNVAPFIAQMVGQFDAQSPLNQDLLQLCEKPILASQIFQLAYSPRAVGPAARA